MSEIVWNPNLAQTVARVVVYVLGESQILVFWLVNNVPRVKNKSDKKFVNSICDCKVGLGIKHQVVRKNKCDTGVPFHASLNVDQLPEETK
ncbi:hypothetical protein V6N13_125256 [Hibiscus sabdariffa]